MQKLNSTLDSAFSCYNIMMCTVWHSYAYDFNICNSCHHILASKTFNAVVFDVLSCLYTYIRHIKFIFVQRLLNGCLQCYNACMSCLRLSRKRTNQHQEKPFCPSVSPHFHTKTVVCCVLCSQPSPLAILHAPPPPIFSKVGTNLSV